MNDTRLGAEGVGQVQRVIGVNYLGGHPGHPNPINGCTIVFAPDDIAIEKGANLLFRLPATEVTALYVETEEEVNRRITATRILTTGVFALAIPKKTRGSVLVNLDTNAGPMAFEKVKKTNVEMTKELGSQIARFGNSSGPASATSTPGPVRGGPLTVADELAKLAGLRREGFLTDDEFAAQKARLLDS